MAMVRSLKMASRLLEVVDEERVAVVEADMGNTKTFEDVAKSIEQLSGGRVEILINNSAVMLGAGRSFVDGLSNSTLTEWDETFRLASYFASKAALATATLNFHLESKDQGVIFVSPSPGGVQTDIDEFGILPMTAVESVAHCVSFVNDMAIGDGGQLRNHDGSKSIVADKPR
ncbi:hypothetical protein OG21DRAFT_1487840 [Imleria badia]|nr:hypothetical protein OG21DRAFT_1487840 [Imleria badia]